MTKSQWQKRQQLIDNMSAIGFTRDETESLRRIELTLQSWAERECGDGSSWAIERDDATGKPFNVYHGLGKSSRYPIADREGGAIKRMNAIVAARNARFNGANGGPDDHVTAYHQGDCRGCMLWIVRNNDIKPGERIDSIYTRGVAVCD